MNATVVASRRPAAPRGAQFVGWAIDWVRRVAEQRRQQRAADAVESVRVYAHSIRASQPGLAADLLAAADRHD